MKISEFDFEVFEKMGTYNDKHLSTSNSQVKEALMQFVELQKGISSIFETANVAPILQSNYNLMLKAIGDEYNKLKNFHPTQDAAQDVRTLRQILTSISSRITNFYQNDANFLLNTIAISSLYSTNQDGLSKYFSEKKEEITANAKEISEITEQARLNASKNVTSGYSRIFQNAAEKNGASAKIWLITSICLLALTIALFTLSLYNDWFKIIIKEPLLANGQPVFINKALYLKTSIYYPNLISKIAVLSLSIYIITFSFKQYSIKKHLESLNLHRHNALNSYTLFVDSINPNDPNSRGALMLQVAKAIYEHSPSGYISDKQAESNGIVEFTKFIGNSKGEN